MKIRVQDEDGRIGTLTLQDDQLEVGAGQCFDR